MSEPVGNRVGDQWHVSVVPGSERMTFGDRGVMEATAIICNRDALLLELGRSVDGWHKVRRDPHAVLEYARYCAAFAALNRWDQVFAAVPETDNGRV